MYQNLLAEIILETVKDLILSNILIKNTFKRFPDIRHGINLIKRWNVMNGNGGFCILNGQNLFLSHLDCSLGL